MDFQQNNIYTFYGAFDLTPITFNGFTFDLFLQRTRFKIKSVCYDYSIAELNATYEVPVRNTDIANCVLSFGVGSTTNLTKCFENVAVPPGGAFVNGVLFQMYEPGQRFFDNWLISENLPIQVNARNDDLFDTLSFYFSLTIEIDILNFIY